MRVPAEVRSAAWRVGLAWDGAVRHAGACSGRMRCFSALVVLVACMSPASQALRRSSAPSRVAVAPVPASEGRFPVPPHQHDPWSGDPRLPLLVRQVAQTLFEQGFADPRGCAYREIELAVGNVRTGEARTVKTRGFVLPGQPYAIAWNGLVYPVAATGREGDLAAEIAALLAGPPAELPSDEAGSVMPARSVEAVLLLARRDEGALADQLWRAIDGHPGGFPDVYGPLAIEWAWRIYDRAITAHMRGGHPLALESLRLLAGVQVAVEATAAAHGVPRRYEEAPYLAFLQPLPALVADEERRAARGSHPPLAEANARARLAPAARIAALIDHLDEVAARQDPDDQVQTGAIALSSDPIVAALIEVGPAAVEPLIEVIASDPRLTRSVRWSDGSRSRWPVEVAEAAYVAVTEILDTERFPPMRYPLVDTLAGRQQLAVELRAYWQRWRSVPVEERWFGDLADEDAGAEIWLEAAEKITSENGVATPTCLIGDPEKPAGFAGTGMRGERLRGHRAPSVADLIAMRIESAGLRDGCSLALLLSRWDPAAGAPRLDEHLRRVIEDTGTSHRDAHWIRMLTEAALAGGHKAVLDVYAAWLETSLPPPPTEGVDAQIFAPMWASPHRPSLARAAERLFRDGSPWVPLVVPDKRGRADLTELLYDNLIAVPAFNRHVRKMLADQRPVGGLEMLDDGPFVWTIQYPQVPITVGAATPLPAVGTKRIIRMADWYAYAIAQGHRDAPHFELVWTDRDRNAALVAMAGWVKDHIAKP
jgi:hypothetical protein